MSTGETAASRPRVPSSAAGVDELLHGSNHTQGWGQPAASDPTLLRVRGDDPLTGAFKYDVNQRFATRVSNIIGPGRTRRGEKRNVQQMRGLLLQSFFNPLQGLLQVKDSLSVLSQSQIDRLTQLQRRLVAKQDSIWAPIVTYLTNMPDTYDLDEAVAYVRPGRMAAFDTMIAAMEEVTKILTPEQIVDFPPALRSSFDLESLKAQRPTKGFFPAY